MAPNAEAISCHVVELTWQPPTLGAEKLPIIEYAVLYSDGVTHIASGSVSTTSYTLGGLSEKGV